MEEEKKDGEKTCKAIMVGESGVGKTSLISQFARGKADEGVSSTTGASFDTATVKFEEFNITLNYQLWDTAGQERYRGLTRIFYIDASMVVFVYDITSRQSFEEVKNYWKNEILENAPKDISKN